MNAWERALPGQYPIVAYLCIASQLPILRRKQSRRANHESNVQLTLLREPETDSNLDVEGEATGKITPFLLRLPYTEVMLKRRYENSGDGPAWYLWERLPHALNRVS